MALRSATPDADSDERTHDPQHDAAHRLYSQDLDLNNDDDRRIYNSRMNNFEANRSGGQSRSTDVPTVSPGGGNAYQPGRLTSVGPLKIAPTSGGTYDRPGNAPDKSKGGGAKDAIGKAKDADGSAKEGVGGSRGGKGKTDKPKILDKDQADVAQALTGTGGILGTLKGVRAVLRRRKNGMIALILALVLIGLITVASVITLSMQALSLAVNIQKVMFSSVEEAADAIDDNLFKNYVLKKVMPGMIEGKCKTTKVSKSCALVSKDDGMIGKTWNAWKDANLEGWMANRGFEIIREGNGSASDRFYIRAPGINEKLDVGNYNGGNKEFEGRFFALMDKKEVRAAYKPLFKDGTLADKLIYRWGLKLLEYKYGVRACVGKLQCAAVNKIEGIRDKWQLRKMAWKSQLAERVLLPYSESVSMAMSCAIQGYSCAEMQKADEDGQRMSKFQKDLVDRYKMYRSTHGEASLEELDKTSKEIKEGGFTRYVIKRLLGETAAKLFVQAADASNPIGWVLMAINASAFAASVGPALMHINYIMNSSAMVQLSTMVRTYVDQFKPGFNDLFEAGSMVAAFGSNKNGAQGAGSAQDSPAYKAMFTNDTFGFAPSGSLSSDNYTANTTARCNNGLKYRPGELVCPEVSFSSTSAIAGIIILPSDLYRFQFHAQSEGSVLLQKFIDAAFDFLLSPTPIGQWIIDKIMALPIVADVSKYLLEHFQILYNMVANVIMGKLIIPAIGENDSGSRTFEAAAGGFNVSANQIAQYRQGGSVQSDETVRTVRLQAKERRIEEFKHLSLKDKLFDNTNSLSAVSQFALAMPIGDGTVFGQFHSIVLGTWQVGLNNVGSMFGATKASANGKILPDPWKVIQYGWGDLKDWVFTKAYDETAWTDEGCDDPDYNRKWGDKATDISSPTGEPIQRERNRCLLWRSAAAASAGLFNKDLLSDPKADSGVGTPATNSPVSVDGWTFPLITTKSAIINHRPGPWCYDRQTNCHHDYPAADIMSDRGTTVVAARPGYIITKKHANDPCTGALGGYPTIQIKGDDGNYYFYAHFEPGSLTSKEPGTDPEKSHVNAGEVLGKVGYDLCGQGASHLHLQWYTDVINGNGQAMNIQPPLVKAFSALPD